MAEVDLDGVTLLDLQRLQKITEGRGSAEQKAARVRLFLVKRDIRRALANKEAEARRD